MANNNQNKMTKAEIVNNIYGQLGVKHSDIHNVINSFFGEIKNALVNDRVIEFRGFGTFEVRTFKGRENARNPKTGAIVPTKAHGVPVFRPGKELKLSTWDLRS